jgi:hypothetical protein
MPEPLFPSPLSSKVEPDLVFAIDAEEQFKIRINWAKDEIFFPQYHPSYIASGTYVIITHNGFYHIAIVNGYFANCDGRFVRVQHIPRKRHIQGEQRLSSEQINMKQVYAKFVRQP